MRVAHVSDCYLPRTGGIELQVRGLSQAQSTAGQDPFIVTATPRARGTSLTDETDVRVPIHRLAINLPGGLPVSPYIGSRLRNLLTANADVVHIHGGLISPFAWPALRTAVHAQLPVVVSVHSVWAGWSRFFAAAHSVSGWRRWPVVWTAVSDVAAEPLRHALGESGTVHVLPNGIDSSTWRPATPAIREDSTITIVTVARLAMRKRGLALVDVLQRVRELVGEDTALRAILVGDGPDRTKIERTLARRGMDWVECAGWRTHDQIRQIFAESDIFVNPALLESFGIAALEARAFGLPVVALADSGVAEFITNGREGFLARDDAGLAEAIALLASDADLLKSMTEYNKATPPPFDWPCVVEEADRYYQLAIDLAARR